MFIAPDGLPTLLQQNYSHESISARSTIDNPERFTRASYLTIVRNLMSENRGIELPGVIDSRLVRELFCDQSQKWLQIAEQHLNRALELVEET